MTRTRLVLSKGDDLLGPPRRAESARARALVLSKGGDPLGPPRRAKSTRARALVAMAVAALSVLSGCSLAQLGTRPRPEAVPPVAAVTPSPTSAPTAAPKAEPGPTEPPLVLRAKAMAPFGTLVVDAQGRTLYRSDRDRTRPPRSRCAGACARTWPPATVPSPEQVRVAGIDPDLVGTVRRADGRLQLTLAGHPLYRFHADRRPGDLKGQCKDGVFFAATPEGGKTTMSAA